MFQLREIVSRGVNTNVTFIAQHCTVLNLGYECESPDKLPTLYMEQTNWKNNFIINNIKYELLR